VNAVLRRLAAEPIAWPEGEPTPTSRSAPGCRGGERAPDVLPAHEVEPAAGAFASPASLCLRANPAVVAPELLERALRDAGLDPRPASLDPACILLDGGDPARLPGYEEGWFAVQDQASAFVVRALDPRPGDRMLDACAAPGGKTTYAAALVGDEGLVVGADSARRPCRPDRVGTRSARRSPARARAGRHRAGPARPFDRILVDAPCSGWVVPSAPRTALARSGSETEHAGTNAGRDRVVGGGPPRTRWAPRLLRVHVPEGRDRRSRRRDRPSSSRPRAGRPTALTGRRACAAGHIATAATACSSPRSSGSLRRPVR
jgi:hypothetical protein